MRPGGADRQALTTALATVTGIVEAQFGRLLRLPAWVPTAENRRLRGALGVLDLVVARLIPLAAAGHPGRTCCPHSCKPGARTARQ